MTLLVLDLKFPGQDGVVSLKDFVSLVWTITPNIIAWLFSFALLSRLWMMHHKLVAGVATYVLGAIFLWSMWREIRKEDMPSEVGAEKDRTTRWILIWFPAAGVAACAFALVDTRISMVPWMLVLTLGVFLGRPQK